MEETSNLFPTPRQKFDRLMEDAVGVTTTGTVFIPNFMDVFN
jgi:hypothetical protein